MRKIVFGGWVAVQSDSERLPVARRDHGILVDEGKIAEIDHIERLRERYPTVPLEGGSRYFVIPGLINAHHHIGLTPFQLGSPDLPLELWWASRLAARRVDLRLDTLYSAFEMVSSGVTTVQHLHGRVGGTLGHMTRAADAVIGAYKAIGMRVSYSMGFRDQNSLVYQDDETFFATLPDHLASALRQLYEGQRASIELHEVFLDNLLQRYQNDDMVGIQLAPSNLHWCSDDALMRLSSFSATRNLPMHMHLDETPYQKEYARRRTGASAILHLERLGMLTRRLTIGHGVWCSEHDIERIAAAGTRICCNCSSNLRLRSGIAPLTALTAAGIEIALGIDEAGLNDNRDMLQEIRLALRLSRPPGIEHEVPSASEVLRIATLGGAATTPFERRIGSIEVGKEADLVLLDWEEIAFPYLSPSTQPIDAVVLRAQPSNVKMVLVGGEKIYEHGTFTNVSKGEAMSAIHEAMKEPLSQPEREREELSKSIMPYVKDFYRGYLDGVAITPFYVHNSRR